MPHTCKILADSIYRQHRLITFELTFPRIILSEWNTHRVFSRNSASSRAIPVKVLIERVMTDPYIPSTWGKNQKGMSAAVDILGEDAVRCQTEWLHARDNAVYQAQKLMEIGVHKQLTNRLLEPFMWHTIINSATEHSNFLGLRDNKAAHPDIQIAARMMRECVGGNTPRILRPDDWHIPFSTEDEWTVSHERNAELEELIEVATGRCARISYLTHDGKRDKKEDVRIHDDLLGNGHMSPFEHCARPMNDEEYTYWFRQPKMVWNKAARKFEQDRDVDGNYDFTHFCGNFQGWVQYRKQIPHEDDYGTYLQNLQQPQA